MPFLSDDTVEEHLQQQVAQLVAEHVVAAEAEGVVHLMCLLDQVGTKRLVRLRGVPVAAGAQITHQRKGIFKTGFRLHRYDCSR